MLEPIPMDTAAVPVGVVLSPYAPGFSEAGAVRARSEVATAANPEVEYCNRFE